MTHRNTTRSPPNKLQMANLPNKIPAYPFVAVTHLNAKPKSKDNPTSLSSQSKWQRRVDLLISLSLSLSLRSEMGFWFLQLGLSQNPPFQSDKFPYPWWNLFFVLCSVSLSLRSCAVLCVCCNMWTLSLLISYQVWIYFFQFRCS